MALLEEQDGAVVGMFWNIKCTLLALPPTTRHDQMRVIGYLLHLGCVSCGFKVICVPPPILLVLHLKLRLSINVDV